MAKKVLGKGLSAIIPTRISAENDEGRIIEISVSAVKSNPDQPRRDFNETEIRELAESIKSAGLIQPVIVRRVDDDYVIVAGERRLRASQMAGFRKIKAIVMTAGEEENLILSLVENIQRTDLNPLEEAEAYKILSGRFKLKQQNIADRIGKDRATIANTMRLLNLPDEIKTGLMKGKISAGHAKILLSLKSSGKQKDLYYEVINKGLSVRDLEKIIINTDKKGQASKSNKSSKDPHLREIEEKLISYLGTKVEVRHSGEKGKIEISYFSLDDFDRIMDLITK